jgi:hypothetical protein
LKLAILPSIPFAALGMLLGIGGTTFNYAEGLSYLRAREQIGAGTQEPRKKELLKPP